MKIAWHTVLLWLTLALTGLAGPALADESAGYRTLPVPDVGRAADFFERVLNCTPIGDPLARDRAASALLDCGESGIVALTRSAATAAPAAATALPEVTLTTDNAASTANWLRANRVSLVGPPQRIALGAGIDEVVVRFLSPWGQRMRLVSKAASMPGPPAAPVVAGKQLAAH